MILAWLVWPLIVIVAVLGKAFWLSLRHWKIPVLAGVIAIPSMYVALVILEYVAPDKPADSSNRFQEYQFMLRWWDRWRQLGVARLIPNNWPMKTPHYPNNTEMWSALLHLFAAASLTVALAIFALVFVKALLETLSTVGKPYRGRMR